MDFAQYIQELINEVKGLFGARKRFVSPSHPTPYSQGKKPIIGPGGYAAPIHGSWASSGGFSEKHKGLDLRAPAGTPIYPLTSGIVTNVGTDPLGGNVVNVAHAEGIKTYYAHMSSVRVQKGDRVNTNTILGLVGQSGNARHTFPHCHFQAWVNGQITDPANFFSVPPYTDLSAEEKRRGMWLSERAKQEAQEFNMQEYLTKRRVAFSEDANKLLKVASAFYKLAQDELKDENNKEPEQPEAPKSDTIKVWLDDARPAPPGWVWTKKVGETINLLASGKVEEISLDHDLGDWIISAEGEESGDFRDGAKELTGQDVVLWMAKHNAFPPIVRVHSQNPIGRKRMEKTIDRYAPGVRKPQAFPVKP